MLKKIVLSQLKIDVFETLKIRNNSIRNVILVDFWQTQKFILKIGYDLLNYLDLQQVFLHAP